MHFPQTACLKHFNALCTISFFHILLNFSISSYGKKQYIAGCRFCPENLLPKIRRQQKRRATLLPIARRFCFFIQFCLVMYYFLRFLKKSSCTCLMTPLNANSARIFGITIKELKVSCMVHTSSTSASEPRNTHTATITE